MAKSSKPPDHEKREPSKDIRDFSIWFYDPVQSLLSGSPRSFIDYEGRPVKTRKDTQQILRLASEAADVLLGELGISDMKRHEWAAFLRDMRGTLDYIRADLPLDRVQFVDKAGNDVPPPLREDVPPALIATIISHTSAIAEAPPELVSLTRRIWCLVCLENVDSALLAQLYEDAGDALGSFSDAAEALRNARGPEKRATSMALKGAMAKLAADPKQAEKRAVRECWELWRQEPARYDGKAAFARDMLQKFESLTSQVTIERWCRLWEMSEQTSSVEPKK